MTEVQRSSVCAIIDKIAHDWKSFLDQPEPSNLDKFLEFRTSDPEDWMREIDPYLQLDTFLNIQASNREDCMRKFEADIESIPKITVAVADMVEAVGLSDQAGDHILMHVKEKLNEIAHRIYFHD